MCFSAPAALDSLYLYLTLLFLAGVNIDWNQTLIKDNWLTSTDKYQQVNWLNS